MLSRPVGGLACKVRLSTRQYKAVAVIARGERHTICLLHGEKGLSVELTEFDDAEAAEDYCHRLAAFLDLPTLLMAPGDGTGKRSARPGPSPRRKMRVRRPRFLTRRKSGDVIDIRKLSGREIIARS